MRTPLHFVISWSSGLRSEAREYFTGNNIPWQCRYATERSQVASTYVLNVHMLAHFENSANLAACAYNFDSIATGTSATVRMVDQEKRSST